MKRRDFVSLGLGLALTCAFVAPASADVLADIKARGVLKVAIDLGNPPYAMMDAAFKPTGSEVETAELLAKDLGWKIEFISVPTSGRIQFIVSGKADMALSTLSITPERLKAVDFSIPYSEATIIVAGPKGAQLKSYAELAGKSVAVTRGTVNDTRLTENTAKVAGVQIVRFEDDPTASAAVTSGQFAYYATSRPLMQALVKSNPKVDLEEKFLAQAFPLGVAIRKGETGLTAVVDAWIKTNIDNGKLVAIYEKYHNAKLDPKRLKDMDPPR